MNFFENFIYKQPGGMYRRFQGISTHFIPKDLSLYRKLLPDCFNMPELPLVGIFGADYLSISAWPMKPYREMAVLLKNEIQGETGWYIATLPVTSWIAKIGGLYLGFPKYMAEEISFVKSDTDWIVRFKQKKVNILTLNFHPGITRFLEAWESELIDNQSLFKGNSHQLIPLTRGKRAQKIMVKHEVEHVWSSVPGMVHVEVNPSEFWAKLVPDMSEFPGSYHYYSGGANLISERFD